MKAKLFAGLMYSKKEVYDKAIEELEQEIGPIKLEGNEFEFNFTKYYDAEMGRNLKKRFILFAEETDIGRLAKIKLKTIEIENKFKNQGKRQINIDPGYITSEVVVASTKQLPHRVPIGEEIFADTQLSLKEGIFRHTFADYRQNKEFFLKAFNNVQK